MSEDGGVRLRDGVRTCVLIFLGVRVGLSLLSVIGVHLVEPLPPVNVPGWPTVEAAVGWHNLWDATVRQDALWFLRIASGGYVPGDGSAAFLPLYPLAIRTLARLPGVSPVGAALLIANASFLGALIVLHGLTRLECGGEGADDLARRTVLFLAIFPTAFFFLAPYTEAPFLLLSVAAFWFARRDRWAWAAVLGGAAALTRSIGVFVAVALMVEAVNQWREGKPPVPRIVGAAAAGLAPLLYLGWWKAAHDDAWAPLRAQGNWGRELTSPLTTLARAVRYANDFGSYWMVDVLVVGVVLIAVVAGIRWLRLSYLVYAVASLLLPLANPFPARPLMSMPRFVIVVFPAFWVIARAVTRRRIPEALVTASFAAGYGVLAVLFINWRYIF
jgi:Mannosyltransferase (PIG-V)